MTNTTLRHRAVIIEDKFYRAPAGLSWSETKQLWRGTVVYADKPVNAIFSVKAWGSQRLAFEAGKVWIYDFIRTGVPAAIPKTKRKWLEDNDLPKHIQLIERVYKTHTVYLLRATHGVVDQTKTFRFATSDYCAPGSYEKALEKALAWRNTLGIVPTLRKPAADKKPSDTLSTRAVTPLDALHHALTRPLPSSDSL